MQFVKNRISGNIEPTFSLLVLRMAYVNLGLRVLIIERKVAIKMLLPAQNQVKQIASLPVLSGHDDGLTGVVLDQISRSLTIYSFIGGDHFMVGGGVRFTFLARLMM